MILSSAGNTVWAADLFLSSDTSLSTEGYFVVNWNASQNESSGQVLQQATTIDFTTYRTYSIPATGSITITGLEDGEYFFRLTTADGEQSEVLAVTVLHHALGRALGFFLIGLLLFLVLVFTIFHGNKHLQERHNAV